MEEKINFLAKTIIILFLLLPSTQAQNKVGVEFAKGMLSSTPTKNKWPPQLPINKCRYNGKTGKGQAHFDCDDYTYAYKRWWDKNYSSYSNNVYQTYVDFNGVDGAHAMIIIKVSSGSSVHSKYCLIEAQGNLSVGCWLQEKKVIEPKIPHFIFNQLKTIYNAESFTQSYTWNKSHHFNGVLKKKYKKYLDNPKLRKNFKTS